ncbi:MAG TPA: alpha/beta hydrolase [Acetobacteraceae bacterium]|nr:alpha/beta hydrolase [Acetobacteraceae bacterium]
MPSDRADHVRASSGCPARPVVFGAGCTGWLHVPQPVARGRGVVLCPAFGYEGLSTYRVLREFAGLLAAHGLPVIRFDYPGTGESLGEDEAPPEPADCIAAALDAAAFLRRHAGVAEIAFAGWRFGALIAAEAAARLPGGAAALALLAPVLSGRAYGRELRLLAHTSSADGDPGESAGYPLSGDFLTALAARDLRRVVLPGAPRVVLVGYPEQETQVEEVAARWAAHGARTEVQFFGGYAKLMAEAHAVEADRDAFDWMLRTLADGAPAAAASPDLPPDEPLVLDDGSVERVVRFGPDNSLVGTWCMPARPSPPGAPPLLILGTGANMRAGNGRLSVLIARHAARLGTPSLRYDATGIGDSENPGRIPLVRLLYSRAAIEDARRALDWLAQQGHGQAMTIGVCTGAYVALHVAVADARVIRAMPLNLQRFLWRDGRVLTVPANRARQREQERLQWQALRDALRARARPPDLLRALLPPHIKHAWKRTVVRSLANFAWRAPRSWVKLLEVGRVRAALEGLAARQVVVRLIYSSDDTGLDEFEAHLGRQGSRIARLPGFAHILIEDGDHTLSTPAVRRRLLEVVEQEIRATQPPAPEAAPSREGVNAFSATRAGTA